jgi:hypothetical protein
MFSLLNVLLVHFSTMFLERGMGKDSLYVHEDILIGSTREKTINK